MKGENVGNWVEKALSAAVNRSLSPVKRVYDISKGDRENTCFREGYNPCKSFGRPRGRKKICTKNRKYLVLQHGRTGRQS
jgi:hypothetical protein